MSYLGTASRHANSATVRSQLSALAFALSKRVSLFSPKMTEQTECIPRDHSHASPYNQISADQKQIRILHLQPGCWKEDLKCSLQVVSLDDVSLDDACDFPEDESPDDPAVIRYEALSYTWGGRTKANELAIDDKYVPITDNLASALRHLRRRDRVRILWIDAICIDQQNLTERAQQVSIMGDIYSQADFVLV